MSKVQNLPLWLATAAVLVFLVFPIIVVMIMSFSDSRFLTFPPRIYSLRWYESYFSNPAWVQATLTSFLLATLSTLLVIPIGVAAAYSAHVSNARWLRHLQLMLLSPVIVPIIIIAAGLYMVYAQVGLLGTKAGLIFAFATMNLPYVFIAVLAGLRSYDMTQEDVARSLGVNRFTAFMKVTLPQIKPSIITGGLFAFIGALDETVISIFIAGGENQTLPSRMFMSLNDEIDPTIASISTILISISFALVVVMTLCKSSKADG